MYYVYNGYKLPKLQNIKDKDKYKVEIILSKRKYRSKTQYYIC